MQERKVIRSRESLKKLPEMMEKLGIRKPLIVGRSLTAVLMRRNPSLLACPVFSAFHANPDLADSQAGAEMFRKEQCDGVISIGGGSAMDTAKAIKARLNAAGDEKLIRNQYEVTENMPHIAIPGTAGSGSEATQIAVTYVDGQKVSLNHPKLLPEGVILDSSLLDSLPLYHKKSCALDALCQGIESWWSRGANDDSRVHAYLAIIGVLDNLKAYLAGDPHAADEMMDASFQSGKAIQITRTTAAHAMSYQITKTLGPAHGHACMLTLPTLWEMMEDEEDLRPMLDDLSAKMRLGDSRMGPKLLRGILYDLEMEIPAMPDPEKLDYLADSVNVERLNNHPMKLNREQIREAYRKAFLPAEGSVKQACLDIWRYYGR